MNRISTAIAAGALVVSAAGAAFLIPSLVAAADPTASPAASTAPAATTAPSTGSDSTQSDPGASTAPNTSTTMADCGPGRGGPGGLDADDLTAAAGALGMSEADLTTALQGGQTFAEVATDQGIDLQKVIDAIVAADTAEIQAKVDDGTITQAQADERIANLEAHVTNEVNGVAPAGMPIGPGGRDHHGQPPAAPSTDSSDTTTSTSTTS